jgi:opacity protein-like surface antigen
MWAFYIGQSNALQRAASLSGLVYLPIPLPVLEMYGRAGVARLESSGSNRIDCAPRGPCPIVAIAPSSFNRTDTGFLYGAGVQAKVARMAVRLEYERINDHYGDPDIVSLGLTWTF